MPTSRSRYREERTLVRVLLPLPGQSRDTFKQNAGRLRGHFEQFNADVAGLSQWLIRFRPGSKSPIQGAQPFWEFFLEPEEFGNEPDESGQHRRRLEAFKAAVGWQDPNSLASASFSPTLQASLLALASLPLTGDARRLFERLKSYKPPHLTVLLKAAAEWIVAKYLRGYENWRRQHEQWEQEKAEWHRQHPGLTGEARAKFNDIFRKLEVREKRPRICAWERLQQNKDNCEYAGERVRAGDKWKSHSTLCIKYIKEFSKTLKPFQKKHFLGNAKDYLARGDIKCLHPSAQKWFPKAWQEYLGLLGVQEDTIRKEHQGRLPHCENLNHDCEFNPHTVKCKEYKNLLSPLPDSLVKLEPLYRDWRRDYLSGPRKPDFRYPSARSLSAPKIFGKHYFAADFERSELGLRLDDMGAGEFLGFAFKPWPRDYTPQPGDTDITSVQIHFVGTRPRAGFRFRVPHEQSRFRCAQDEIDELRSRQFPRKAQDKQFLEAARKRLLESFDGEPEKDLKVLTADLGDRGGYGALFEGKQFKEGYPLKVVKIVKLYDAPPRESRGKAAGGEREGHRDPPQGARQGTRRAPLGNPGGGIQKNLREEGSDRGCGSPRA